MSLVFILCSNNSYVYVNELSYIFKWDLFVRYMWNSLKLSQGRRTVRSGSFRSVVRAWLAFGLTSARKDRSIVRGTASIHNADIIFRLAVVKNKIPWPWWPSSGTKNPAGTADRVDLGMNVSMVIENRTQISSTRLTSNQ